MIPLIRILYNIRLHFPTSLTMVPLISHKKCLTSEWKTNTLQNISFQREYFKFSNSITYKYLVN